MRAIDYCARWDWSIFTVTSGGRSIDNGKCRAAMVRATARRHLENETNEIGPTLVMFDKYIFLNKLYYIII